MDSDDDAMPRLAATKKNVKKAAKNVPKSERHVASAKKRQRAGSVTKSESAGSDDPRERLAAFHARMFDAKHDETALSLTASADPEDAVLLAKWKPGKDGKAAKKRKTARTGRVGANEDDDDEVMPHIAIKASSSKRATRSSKDKDKDKGSDKASAVITVAAKPIKTAATSSVVHVASAVAAQSPALKRKTAHSADDNKASVALSSMNKRQQPSPMNKRQQLSLSSAASGAKAPKLQKSKGSALGALDAKENAAATVSTVAAALVAAIDPIGTSSKATSSSVVTQDELSKLNDELSLEDPLERVLRTAKAQAAKSHAAKIKVKGKTKKQQRQRAHLSDIGAGQTDTAPMETASLIDVQPTAPSSDEKSASTAGTSLVTVAQQRAKYKKQRKQAKLRAMSVDLGADGVAPQEQEPFARAATASSTMSESVPAPASKSNEALDDATPKLEREARMTRAAKKLATASHTSLSPAVLDVGSKQVSAPVSDSDDASEAEVLKSEHRRLTRHTKHQKVTSASGALAGHEVPTPVAEVMQLPPAPKQKAERGKRVRAEQELLVASSTTAATTAARSAKPPTKRQRAEKLLMERRAVAQAAAVADIVERISSDEGVDVTASELHSESDDGAGDTQEHNTHDDEANDDGEASDASATTGSSAHQQIFSKLIDEAARQQWELLEVGRLVKLFAGQWGHKKKKTARFLRRVCPELVSVEFLEGLDTSLKPAQLIKIFERGSGTAAVLMNKLASAVENGNLTVRDAALVDAVTTRAQHMATNHEVLAFLLPLLESLSTVRDAGALLQHVCAHWHIERAATLVQQVLLTPVFHDLDGNQDEILRELPHLRGKLDFPSRLDQEDADEHGNLIGLIASEGSDLGEESSASDNDAEDALSDVGSDDDDEYGGSDDDDDADGDELPYEGETDSEEERVVRRPKRRSRFVLDEADDGSEDEDEDKSEDDDEANDSDGDEVNDAADLVSEDSSSESDSEDESWRSKPKSGAALAKL